LIDDHIPALRSAETQARGSTTEPDEQQQQYLRLKQGEPKNESTISPLVPILNELRNKIPMRCGNIQISSFTDASTVLEQTSAEIDRLRGLNNNFRRSKDSVQKENLNRAQVEEQRGKIYTQGCELSELKLQIAKKDKILFENSNAIQRLELTNKLLMVETLEIGRLRKILKYHKKKLPRKEKLPTKIRYPQSKEQQQLNYNIFFTELPFFLSPHLPDVGPISRFDPILFFFK